MRITSLTFCFLSTFGVALAKTYDDTDLVDTTGSVTVNPLIGTVIVEDGEGPIVVDIDDDLVPVVDDLVPVVVEEVEGPFPNLNNLEKLDGEGDGVQEGERPFSNVGYLVGDYPDDTADADGDRPKQRFMRGTAVIDNTEDVTKRDLQYGYHVAAKGGTYIPAKGVTPTKKPKAKYVTHKKYYVYPAQPRYYGKGKGKGGRYYGGGRGGRYYGGPSKGGRSYYGGDYYGYGEYFGS